MRTCGPPGPVLPVCLSAARTCSLLMPCACVRMRSRRLDLASMPAFVDRYETWLLDCDGAVPTRPHACTFARPPARACLRAAAGDPSKRTHHHLFLPRLTRWPCAIAYAQNQSVSSRAWHTHPCRHRPTTPPHRHATPTPLTPQSRTHSTGVVWLGEEAVPGVPETLAELRRRGKRVFFVSNNASKHRCVRARARVARVPACARACECVCVHNVFITCVCMHVCMCTRTRARTCMHVHTHKNTHKHTHQHAHTQTHKYPLSRTHSQQVLCHTCLLHLLSHHHMHMSHHHTSHHMSHHHIVA